MYTFADKANAVRSEFDGRHPKMRLTLVAYLVDAGFTPRNSDPVEIENWVSSVDTIMDWVTADMDDYVGMLPDLDGEPTESAADIKSDGLVAKKDEFGGTYL